MKRILMIVLALAMLLGTACAQGLPYETFVKLENGDRIDFDGDGVEEEILFEYRLHEDGYGFNYDLGLNGEIMVSDKEKFLWGEGDPVELYAVEMGDGFFLFVPGSGDNDMRVHDVFRMSKLRRRFDYVDSIGIVQRETLAHFHGDDWEASGETAELASGAKIAIAGAYPEDEPSVYDVLLDGRSAFVSAEDVRCVDRYDEEFERLWELRFVTELWCMSDVRDIRISNHNSITAMVRSDEVCSPMLRRAEFVLLSKDYERYDEDSDEYRCKYYSGDYQLPYDSYALNPTLLAPALMELELYDEPDGEVVCTLAEGDFVVMLAGNNDHWIYLEEIREDAYYSELKRGWFRMNPEDYSNDVLVDGEWVFVAEVFDGLHFGG